MKTPTPIATDRSVGFGGSAAYRLRRGLDRWFYFGMAWLVLLVVAYGFGRNLSERLLQRTGTEPLPWILHVHALAFAGWVVLFLVQSGLVRGGALRLHRRLGLFGGGRVLVRP